jgi:hypothetical protein
MSCIHGIRCDTGSKISTVLLLFFRKEWLYEPCLAAFTTELTSAKRS